MEPQRAIDIGLVLYPGAQQSAVLGLADLFAVANRAAERTGLHIRVTHWHQDVPDAAPVCTDAHAPAVPAALVVPPTLGEPPAVEASAPLAAWLRAHHARGTTLGAICVGAFVLAQTGLAAGRRVTTHGRYAPLLQARHPDVRVQPDLPIVDDGDLITAGGMMHWPELGLRLVERALGPAAMFDTARALLVDPPGGGARRPAVFAPPLGHGDAAVLKVQHWLHATGAQDAALGTLAAHAGLEARTFLRRFRKATGMTTTEYCQRLRIGRAGELLQFGRLSIDRVAWEVGYADPGAFRKVFTRFVGMSPGAYRRQWTAEAHGAMPAAVAGATETVVHAP